MANNNQSEDEIMSNKNQFNQIVGIIEDALQKLDAQTRDELYHSTRLIQSVLDRHFHKGNSYESDFNYVKREVAMMVGSKRDDTAFGLTLTELKEFYKNTLKTMLSEVNLLGLPSKNDIKMDKSINIHNTLSQNQSQNQTTNVEFILESLKESLTGKQYKEIEAIAKEEKEPEKAKPKIAQKLLSFGKDVAAHILADLVTSPAVWTRIIG